MSKELPYFRFTVSEWLNGDVSMEQMEDQGLFINICAFYWFKDCSLALAKLKQKFKGAETSLKRLLNSGILKIDENDNIVIDFLDEQYSNLSKLHVIRKKAGRKGGLSKAKAKLKQKPSYKDKDKDNNKDKNKDRYKEVFSFYSNQVELNKEENLIDKYVALVKYLFGENALGYPVDHIIKLKKQLTFDDYKVIFKKAHVKNISISELLDSWVNNPGYSKGKVSVYLTLNSWINRSDGKKLSTYVEKKWTEVPRSAETESLLEIINNKLKTKN